MEEYGIKYTLDANDLFNTNKKLIAQSIQLEETIKETKKALALATPGTDRYKYLFEDLVNDTKKLKKVNEQIKDIGKNSVHSFEIEMGKAIKSGVKSISRLMLSLIGIRSAFALIRKAFTSLQQTNQQLKADIEYINFAIGQALEPVILAIVDAIYWLLGAVGTLVKSWFNFNIFTNATNKNFEKMVRNANKLNKSLASFDTIKNLQEPNQGQKSPGIDLAALVDSGDIVKKIWSESVDDFGKRWKKQLDKSIKEWKKAWGKGSFGKVWGVLIDGFGWALGLVEDGIIRTISGLLDLIEGLIKGDVNQMWEGIKKIMLGIVKTIVGAIANLGLILLSAVAGILNGIWELLKWLWDKISTAVGKLAGWLWDNIMVPIGTFLGNVVDTIWKIIKGLFMTIGTTLGTFVDGIWNTIKTTFEGLLQPVKNVWEGIKKFLNGDVKGGFKEIGKAIGNVFIAILNTVLSLINTVWTTLLSLVDGAGSLFGKKWTLKTNLSIPKIPYLDVGTNVVPKDMLAVVHKGEMVVPKKFNPATSNITNISNSNIETNELLNRLIMAVENKELSATISASDIVNTAIKGINQESRIMGRSVLR